jgi:hypothetical protein
MDVYVLLYDYLFTICIYVDAYMNKCLYIYTYTYVYMYTFI